MGFLRLLGGLVAVVSFRMVQTSLSCSPVNYNNSFTFLLLLFPCMARSVYSLNSSFHSIHPRARLVSAKARAPRGLQIKFHESRCQLLHFRELSSDPATIFHLQRAKLRWTSGTLLNLVDSSVHGCVASSPTLCVPWFFWWPLNNSPFREHWPSDSNSIDHDTVPILNIADLICNVIPPLEPESSVATLWNISHFLLSQKEMFLTNIFLPSV